MTTIKFDHDALGELQTIVFHPLGAERFYRVNYIGVFSNERMSVKVSIDEVQKWVELTWGVT